MTGQSLFISAAAAFIFIPLLSFYIYGVILAVKLIFKGEWQWFCLPFINIPLGIVSKIAEHMDYTAMPPDKVIANIIWAFSAVIMVALFSGGGVYWFMRRYRQETVFIHFYAASFFLLAVILLGFNASIFAENLALVNIFQRILAALPLYGFIVSAAGIMVMRNRFKRYKCRQNLSAKQYEGGDIKRQNTVKQ